MCPEVSSSPPAFAVGLLVLLLLEFVLLLLLRLLLRSYECVLLFLNRRPRNRFVQVSRKKSVHTGFFGGEMKADVL
jgi:hypothetical protein